MDLQGKKVEKVDIVPTSDLTKEFIITGDEPFGSIIFASSKMNPPTLKGFTTVKAYTLRTNIEKGLTIKDIKRINGSLSVQVLTIQGMATSILHDIDLPDLEYVGGNFNISALNDDVPTNPVKVDKLKEIGGSFTLYIHNSQKDFSFLNMKKLETIGTLSISPRTASSLDKLDIKEIFPSLSQLSNVTIRNFSNLYNFSSFKKFIDDGIITKWAVYTCGARPTLQEMKDSPTGDFTK